MGIRTFIKMVLTIGKLLQLGKLQSLSSCFFFRFNDRAFAVDQTNPAFPRSTAYWWFGCQDAPAGTIGTSESRGWLQDEEGGNVPVQDQNGFDMDAGRMVTN